MNFQTDLWLYRKTGYPIRLAVFSMLRWLSDTDSLLGFFKYLLGYISLFESFPLNSGCVIFLLVSLLFYNKYLSVLLKRSLFYSLHHFKWIFKLTYGSIEKQNIRLRPAVFSMLRWLSDIDSLMCFFKYHLGYISPFKSFQLNSGCFYFYLWV